MTTLRALGRGERGDDNVAAVVIFGALLLVVWAVLQLVIVFLGRAIALDAARDGVATARLPPVDTVAAQHRAVDYTSRVMSGWLTDVAARAHHDDRTVTVTVTADAVSLVPFARFPVTQTASGPIETIQP